MHIYIIGAKKKERQLMKLKTLTEASKSDSTENNDINQFLNDNTDDEIMFTFSQAIEKTLENDTNCKTKNFIIGKENTLSIEGISPLKNSSSTITNNNTYHIAKKFKAITSDHIVDENNISNNNNDDSSCMFNDCDDDLFSAVDLTQFDQQPLSNIENTNPVPSTLKSNQILDNQQQNKMYYNNTQFKNIPGNIFNFFMSIIV